MFRAHQHGIAVGHPSNEPKRQAWLNMKKDEKRAHLVVIIMYVVIPEIWFEYGPGSILVLSVIIGLS